MPNYQYECPRCLVWFEDFMPHELMDKAVCPECGAFGEYRPSRFFAQGDTVAGGVQYTGFDPVLKTEIHGKQHRKKVMKEQGLKEYEPNQEIKKARDEAKYIRKHSPRGDYNARIAGGNLVFGARDKVAKRHLSEKIDKVYSDALGKS